MGVVALAGPPASAASADVAISQVYGGGELNDQVSDHDPQVVRLLVIP